MVKLVQGHNHYSINHYFLTPTWHNHYKTQPLLDLTTTRHNPYLKFNLYLTYTQPLLKINQTTSGTQLLLEIKHYWDTTTTEI